MTSFEPLSLVAELAKELELRPEPQTRSVEVYLDYVGYYKVCDRNWTIMTSYWNRRNMGPLPISKTQFMKVCAQLLRKRVGFVWSDYQSHDMPQTGLSKSVLIPETVFDRLYSYGTVRVGNVVYVPAEDQDLYTALSEFGVEPDQVKSKISSAEATAWSLFVGGLEPYMVLSSALPAKATGTLTMLMYVREFEDRNVPMSLTDSATGADAIQAGIAPDRLLRFRQRQPDLVMELRDVLAFVFTVPYTGIDAPDSVLTTFVMRSFRGAGGVNV